MPNLMRILLSSFIFQLCDGTEEDGYPGVSIVKEIQRRKLPFTGADSVFYDVTTAKPTLKRLLQKHGVPTSSFIECRGEAFVEEDVELAEQFVGPYPLIVKVSRGYASIGISDSSVCHTAEELARQVRKLLQVIDTGIFIERFLPGA
jgi:biotin carboxylase